MFQDYHLTYQLDDEDAVDDDDDDAGDQQKLILEKREKNRWPPRSVAPRSGTEQRPCKSSLYMTSTLVLSMSCECGCSCWSVWLVETRGRGVHKDVSRLEEKQDRLKEEVRRLQDECETLEDIIQVHGMVCPKLRKTSPH
ncbi:uncharacterized protein LOC112570484 isoform X2 [Pomacea canaliculata]|uniref:uncharacterized protein LOC112570484 isoform X2 n=1 Tax=Pomacea canaliculata TaxID=400727 RepID=UPI000D73A46E|nr:uncharacterized protein LOC112570484 isoform X2 [Pomacea canaliculata]